MKCKQPGVPFDATTGKSVTHIAPVLLGAGTAAFLPGEDELRSFDVLERSAPDELTTLRLAPRNRRSS